MAMRLAVTVGDPAGIGPEVVLKALARTDRPPAEMIVYGPAAVLRERAARLGLRPLESLDARIVDVPAKGPVPLARTNPLQALFARAGASEASAALSGDGEFQLVYAGLFNEPRKATAPSPRFAAQAEPDAGALAGPANGFLQFPYPRGQRWHVGGAHTNTGSGSYPMSSLDMSLGGGWGSNQSGTWVSSSAAGSFKRHSSCFAEVVHSGGWSTTYYHLMNIQYGTGASVAANTRIANPANTRTQALCNGGSSTGPHEHWSLKSNGSHYHLNGVYLSGFQITAIGTSYDTNCSRFYLTKNGTRYCSGWFTNP